MGKKYESRIILLRWSHVHENSSFDERTNIEGMIDEYADSFKEMARMGFISMDLDDNGRYHIIATPKDQVLSQKIMGMLPDVQAEEIIIE
jgi:hypothetical protein